MKNREPSHSRRVEIGTDEFESVCEEINATGTRFGEILRAAWTGEVGATGHETRRQIFRAAWTGEVGVTGHETRRQYTQSYTVTLTLQPEDWRARLATEEGQ